jgi:lipopolysaccharide export LptBFGC system permease protein LptF
LKANSRSARALSPTEAAKKPQLSIREILAYLRLHPHPDEQRRATLMTQLQCRLAEPFTCLAVVLIALPFGARSGRQNVFAGVASSIFICFGYFFMQKIGMGLGVGGKLPPFLAAWLPNLVFGLAGLVLVAGEVMSLAGGGGNVRFHIFGFSFLILLNLNP